MAKYCLNVLRSCVRCIYHLNKKLIVKPVFKEFIIENDEINGSRFEKGCETLEDIYKDCLIMMKIKN